MRLLALVAAIAAATPALGADLDRWAAPPPLRAPAVILGDVQLCQLGRPIEVRTAPATASNGQLPAGLIVEIVDRPFDPTSDLWVRLRGPRGGEYYGYVAAIELVCI